MPARNTEPEYPTTDYWRGLLKEAREARGMTQRELAAAVRMKQPILSQIESGAIRSSKHIGELSDYLGLPRPTPDMTDDLQRRWVALGSLLRSRDTKLLEAQIAALEAFVATLAKP